MNKAIKQNEHASLIVNDARWQLVLARDKNADGQFYYSVRTTGVYCKPSCAARQALPANVAFHTTREEAEKAGFRPCKRCKPDQPKLSEQHALKVELACRLIETAEAMPTLEELASHVDISVYHFHRIFKAVTGLTPKAYASGHRSKALKEKLQEKMNVTDAIYEAGYGSNSRFYEKSQDILGMKPTDYRKGGANQDIRFAIAEFSMGSILVASSEKGVCAILMGDDPALLARDLQDRFPNSNLLGGDSDFELLVAQVIGFIEAPQLGLDLPLDVRGTAFQQRVWQALREIPHGTTATYTEIAAKIGMPKAVRAVAQACGANVLAVAIPCHRVVRHDGAISGYRWGVERKRELLKKESSIES